MFYANALIVAVFCRHRAAAKKKQFYRASLSERPSKVGNFAGVVKLVLHNEIVRMRPSKPLSLLSVANLSLQRLGASSGKGGRPPSI
jgi:hypothetical protein